MTEVGKNIFTQGRERLREKGVQHAAAHTVLFIMLLKGHAYGEALKDWARIGAPAPIRELEVEMDAAARAAGHPAGMRLLLQEIYREVMFVED